MTKSFSALLVALVGAGLGHATAAQTLPSGDTTQWWFDDVTTAPVFVPYERRTTPEGLRLLAIIGVPLGHTAPPPAWVYEVGHPDGTVDPEFIETMLDLATRPEAWGSGAEPYRVSLPGPSYVGLIPQPVPEGWVVTNRCLEWDDGPANAESPQGECHLFEMRPLRIDVESTARD